MSDIVERLRELAGLINYPVTCHEAADVIEQLRGEVDRLLACEDEIKSWRKREANLMAKNIIDVSEAYDEALEEAAKCATSFLVGDPANGIPLRNPMAHEVADAIRALKEKA